MSEPITATSAEERAMECAPGLDFMQKRIVAALDAHAAEAVAEKDANHSETWDVARREITHLQERLAEKDAEIAKLAAFKAYVHRRLDEAGVPADPESTHKSEGCRVGGRLDIALTHAQKDAEIERLKERVVVTKWSMPGVQTLIMKGSRDQTLEDARAHFGEDPSERERLTGKERRMTNAELETLPEWQS